MSDIIHRLPDAVANQIAAGEVVQRPASVVKELVENAVDAGARNISLFIRDAGRTLIQVIDDGKGMSENDVMMAFERHATSKIAAADDLMTLVTMGFRGEALPSICAVAQVEIRTRTRDSELGTALRIDCARREMPEPCVCDAGTNIMVKNLFCNVPARRKFLRSDASELAAIMREFERLALVNHRLHLSIDTGGKVLDLRPGTFKQRIADIWKNNLNLQLLPVEVETSLVKISGFVSRPEFARRRNPLQYLIANGRNMKHPYFRSAILSCYEQLTAPDTQPCFFLRFDVDPATIDVNIHPTKNEIKFENEQEIWRILQSAVRAALGKFSAVPSIDFEADPLPATPRQTSAPVTAPPVGLDPTYDPFAPENNAAATPQAGPGEFKPVENFAPTQGGYTPPQKPPRNWNRLYNDFMEGVKGSDRRRETPRQTTISAPKTPSKQPDVPQESDSPLFLQQGLKYIVTTSARGLIIIDQYRAHLKILYEEFMEKARQHTAVGQHILFPLILDLEPAQTLTLEGIEDELQRMGFVITNAGNGRWQIEAVPSQLTDSDPKDLLLKIIDSLQAPEHEAPLTTDDEPGHDGLTSSAAMTSAEPAMEATLSKIAKSLARTAAIKGGRALSQAEMEQIVSRLFRLPDPNFSPDGLPVLALLDPATLL